MEGLINTLRDRLRASAWLIIACLGLAWLVWFAPYKIGVGIWLITKVFGCAFAGYWIDRIAFPYLRPHEMPDSPERSFRLVCRATIIGACIIAGGLQA